MRCQECDAEVLEGDKFCFACGAAVKAFAPPQREPILGCPKCGEEAEGNDKFCGNCGTEIQKPENEKPG